MQATRKSGFTLIEILVAISIFAVLMTVVMSTIQISNQSSRQTMSRSELQQEMLNAQQLIGARVKEAVYIYNGSGDPSINTITLGTGVSTKNPATNTGTWRVGNWVNGSTISSQNILALVLPPRNLPGTCSNSNDNNCHYRFFAYYPVLRSVLEDNGQIPKGSVNNRNLWVLMEYRSYFSSQINLVVGDSNCTALATAKTINVGEKPYVLDKFSLDTSQPLLDSCRPPLSSVANTGVTAQILADYIAPTTKPLFEYADLIPPALQVSTASPVEANRTFKAQNYGASGVNINLATQATFGGTTYRFPQAGALGTDKLGAAITTYNITSTSFNTNLNKYRK